MRPRPANHAYAIATNNAMSGFKLWERRQRGVDLKPAERMRTWRRHPDRTASTEAPARVEAPTGLPGDPIGDFAQAYLRRRDVAAKPETPGDVRSRRVNRERRNGSEAPSFTRMRCPD
jgi:hypothetical protein